MLRKLENDRRVVDQVPASFSALLRAVLASSVRVSAGAGK